MLTIQTRRLDSPVAPEYCSQSTNPPLSSVPVEKLNAESPGFTLGMVEGNNLGFKCLVHRRVLDSTNAPDKCDAGILRKCMFIYKRANEFAKWSDASGTGSEIECRTDAVCCFVGNFGIKLDETHTEEFN